MSKKTNKTQRKTLITFTFVASLAVFFIILIAIFVALGLLYLMMRLGLIFSLNTEFELWQMVLFLGAISAIIGFGMSMLLSKIPLTPINRFISYINMLADGNYSARFSFGALNVFPVFEEASDSLNKLAEELDNTEMLRSDFINNFSHEFKTPIVSIAGFTKLLKRGNLTEEQRAEYLDIIEAESMRLSAMATNVLNLTKIENQMILTDVTQFNLSEQIRSAILMLEVQWTKKQIEFNIDFGEYTIAANAELLKQVWINLIDNAIKFSPEGGEIDIEIAEDTANISVTVRNTGTEISPEQQRMIFKKFYQADESHSSEGSGIGLALVKRIVELHNGNVTVSSGNGSTEFTVSLPTSRNTAKR